ncbi:MAG: peptidylprolyl isomerase [Bradymonadaceae bacterium]
MRLWKTLITIGTALLLVAATGCDKGSSNKKDKGADKDKTAKKKSESDKSKGDKSGDSSSLPYEATGPVAVVDGKEISAKEFNEIVKKQHGNSRRKLPKPMAERMKSETLNAVVDKHLIERKLDKSDIEITDKEINKEFKKFTDRFPNEKAMSSFLKMRNTSKKEIKGQMKKDLELQEILRKRGGIEVTDKKAKKYYENNPKEFQQKEKVKARHILIKTKPDAGDKKIKKARKKAKKLAKKAQKKDADFAKLAKKHSDGPSAKKGGDLGFFTKDRMVPEFSKKAFSMKNGDVSDPVKTKFGFHIIKREGHKKVKKQSFEEVKSDIVQKLEKKQFRKALDKYLKELKKKAEIKKKPENIKVNVEATKKGGPAGLKGLGGALKGKGAKQLKLKMKKMKQIQQQKQKAKESGGSKGSESGSK